MDIESNTEVNTVESSTWSYIDTQNFRKKFTSEKEPNVMRFYVEGVGCSKCLAKIENLKKGYSQVIAASMDMSKNILRLEITPHGSFAPFITGLTQIGYTAHPISQGKDQSAFQNLENQKMLKKIGVAAFCTGNIMLFAISSYGGLSGVIEGYFNWLSFALAVPVLIYSASPFYLSLWNAFKDKRPSIDLPIVAALLIGFFLSALHTIRGDGDVYFDTLSTLVLLLLSARYFLKRIQQSYLSSSFFLPFLNLDKVRRWSHDSHSFTLVPLENVNTGDLLLIKKGEKVPADGIARFDKDNSNNKIYLNNAFLTGESYPAPAMHNETVYAGAELLSESLRIEVTATGDKTRLGSLFEKMEEEVLRRTPLISLTDKLAKWFTIITLTTGGLFFLYYSQIDINEATRRSLALVILACPCALALATPLTQSLSLLKAARQGYVVKTAEILEKLNKVNIVAFDKTGTLTEGNFRWISWSHKQPDDKEKSIIVGLEQSSQHPIAKALLTTLSGTAAHPDLKNITETHGRGVSGVIGKQTFEIRALNKEYLAQDQLAATQIGLYCDDVLVTAAQFGDQLRPDSQKLLASLQDKNIEVHILSGDGPDPVQNVAKQIGLPFNQAHSQMSPEAKLEWIKTHNQQVMMVGDGANDAAALAASPISVAVQGSMEVSLHAADIYLSNPGVTPVLNLLLLGQDTMKVVYRNLGFSLIYNFIGGVAALAGYVNPLVAAVLMPISSLFVLMSSLWGTSFLRSLNKKREK